MNKAQRKDNARIVSIPFAYCKLSHKDDWLVLEGSPEDLATQALLMTDEDVRMLNSEFNYRHYGAFYEKIEEA